MKTAGLKTNRLIEEWRATATRSDQGLEELISHVRAFDTDDPAWISLGTEGLLRAQIDELRLKLERAHDDLSQFPLFGVPFGVKDNIDVSGFLTTCACPAFAYRAEKDAVSVELLKQAGAIVVGKTNLDQFATGLVGTRSPYGVVESCHRRGYIGGGSSSGSASAVARGLVPFALGTDTAGSGRVPAAFQNIVGYKPTKGRFSTRGVVPACRTLDCVSIFAFTVDDAARVAKILDVFDEADAYARPAVPATRAPLGRIGYPAPLEFYGDQLAEEAYRRALETVAGLGAELIPVDFEPFSELARLLYAAPWVAERTLVAGALLDDPGAMDPTVRQILQRGAIDSARDAFRAEYRRAELSRAIELALRQVDLLVVPTTPTIYRIDDVLADPIGTNSRLGTYTNFTNLADLAGIAIPAPFRRDGLPSGITLLGPAHSEPRLLDWARRIERTLNLPWGATGPAHALTPPIASPSAVPLGTASTSQNPSNSGLDSSENGVLFAVVGAHLRGMPLHHELVERGGRFHSVARTAPLYELHLLAGTSPAKPGLLRLPPGQVGSPIEVELWLLSDEAIGSLLRRVAPPLGFGKLQLEDGRWVSGFICEPVGFEGGEDISHYGGFRAYQNRTNTD